MIEADADGKEDEKKRINLKRKMDRSATSVMFGFLFQANAAIVLMLDNMKELKSIRLECNEDIDIELIDGSYLLAQAKSVVKASTDFTHVRANVTKAMESLSDGAKKVNARELVFISNSPNPFNDDASKNLFYGNSIEKYENLPPSTKEIIDVYLSRLSVPLDKNKLVIRAFPFEGDDDRQRYKVVLTAISDFMERIGLGDYGYRQKLHEVWESMLYRSGSKSKKEIKLGKKDIVWPIIVCVTGQGNLDRNALYCTGLDDSEFAEINNRYRVIIDYCSERFDFVAKVISDSTNAGIKDRDAVNMFINDHWSDYTNDVELDSIDEDIRSSLIKIIMYTILSKKYVINRIKKEVNL
jgi:hypothetical protein